MSDKSFVGWAESGWAETSGRLLSLLKMEIGKSRLSGGSSDNQRSTSQKLKQDNLKKKTSHK